MRIRNWARYDESTLSFLQEVYGPVVFHVSGQSYASEQRTQQEDIVNHGAKLRLPSKWLHF